MWMRFEKERVETREEILHEPDRKVGIDAVMPEVVAFAYRFHMSINQLDHIQEHSALSRVSHPVVSAVLISRYFRAHKSVET